MKWMSDRNKTLRMVAILILAVFLVSCAAYLYLRGIRFGGDSQRYIQGADRILQGLPLEGKQRSYPGYILLVAAFDFVGLGLPGLIAFQILVALLAAVVLVRLGNILASPSVGLLAATFFLFNFEIFLWHTYILTDSLFISSVVIATYAVYMAGSRPGTSNSMLALIALAVCISLRPHGWILLPAAIIYWVFWSPHLHRRQRLVSALLTVFIGVLFIPGFKSSMQAENPAGAFGQGVVIWDYEDGNLDMPVEDGDVSSSLITYIIKHPLASLELGVTRVVTELIRARPYYSTLRNALILAYLMPIYILAIAALYIKRREPLVWIIVLLVVSLFLSVAITFADWSGRFQLYVLPLIQLLAAVSTVDLLSWLHFRTLHSKEL